MGYGYYKIARPGEFKPMERGYGVRCKCHKRGCKKQIDRGMAYLCYSCTWYFCGDHLGSAYGSTDEAIQAECFAGESSQVCEKCEKLLEKNND